MLRKNTTLLTVSYNSLNVIKIFLNQKRLDSFKEIIVIDNRSLDGTINYIKENFPSVLCIENDKNYGYGKAVNIGLNYVKTNYVLITNPDTIFSNSFFLDLENAAKRYPIFSILSPSFFNYKEIKNFNGISFSSNQILSKPNSDYKATIPGPCFLANLNFFNDKKIWDDQIFLYFEDHDLVRRLKDKKIPIITLFDCHIFNIEGGSTPNSFDLLRLKNWHYGWSFMYFKRKYNEKNIYVFILTILKRLLVSIFLMKKNKFYTSYFRLKGCIAFKQGIKSMDIRDLGPF